MAFKLNHEINIDLNLILIPLIMVWFVLSFIYYKGLFYSLPDGFKVLTVFDVIYNFKLLTTLFLMMACSLVPIFYPTSFTAVELRIFNFIIYLVIINCYIYAKQLSSILNSAALIVGMNPLYLLAILKIISTIAILVPFYWYLITLLKTKKNLISNISIAILFILFLSWLCYMQGVVTYDAGSDKEGKSKLYIALVSGSKINIDLIASLDKGVLINDKDSNEVKIIGWGEVGSIGFL